VTTRFDLMRPEFPGGDMVGKGNRWFVFPGGVIGGGAAGDFFSDGSKGRSTSCD
jgi:hypothetical protein